MQHVLYGKNLGLSLPARDPWSYSTLEDIKGEDVAWLDSVFTTAQGVSVMERLAAFAGGAAPPPGTVPHFAAPPADPQQLRIHDLDLSADPPSDDDGDDADDMDGEDIVAPSHSLRGGAGTCSHLPGDCQLAVHIRAVLSETLLVYLSR